MEENFDMCWYIVMLSNSVAKRSFMSRLHLSVKVSKVDQSGMPELDPKDGTLHIFQS